MSRRIVLGDTLSRSAASASVIHLRSAFVILGLQVEDLGTAIARHSEHCSVLHDTGRSMIRYGRTRQPEAV